MVEPEKPFACTMPECGMTFTNEDHLHVHTKKHDMVLQFGMEQKAAFVADQTPTPTRFIRNCEEVGLFQDLQNVNPFDEGFKRAMETKHGILSLENAIAASASDDLHTPQMMFPLIDSGDSSLYSTTNNQRNITISRSSSDESGAIKEFETTTISKLTNEVTTISRIIGKQDDAPKTDDTRNKEGIRTDSVSYRNNVIIHSNVEIRKDIEKPLQTLVSYEDTVKKEGNIINRDVFDTSKLQVPDVPPIMSQKSIDLVVESLTSDICKDKADIPHKEPSKANKSSEDNSYEVIIKLPNGKKVIMKSAEEINETKNTTQNTKEMLKKALTEKVEHKNLLQKMNTLPNILQTAIPIPTCTLVPVSIVSQNHIVPKIAIPPFRIDKTFDKKPVKRKNFATDVRQCKNINRRENNNKISGELNQNVEENSKKCKTKVEVGNVNENCVIINGFERGHNKNQIKTNYVTKNDLESRSAASRRYRARLKEAWVKQAQEMRQLRETNERLTADKAILKTIIMEHMKRCPNAEDLRLIQEKLCQNGTNI